MKKINKVIIITLVAILFTSGCSIFKINNDDKVDKTFKQFVKYINDENANEIKKLFSKNTLSSPTIDADLNYIFELIDGEIVNWEENGEKYQNSKKRNRNISDYFEANYIIETKSSKYYIDFSMFTVNELNSDEEGVKEVVVLNNKQYNDKSADCYIFAGFSGIYNPNNDYSIGISNAYMNKIKLMFDGLTYEKNMIATEPPWARKALVDYKKLESDGQYFFNFINGNINSWEILEGPVTSKINMNGREIITLETSYDVKTEHYEIETQSHKRNVIYNNYVIYLLIYQNDQNEIDNVGLYSIRVESKESNISLKDAFDDTSKPGIYNPNNN